MKIRVMVEAVNNQGQSTVVYCTEEKCKDDFDKAKMLDILKATRRADEQINMWYGVKER